MHKQTQIRATFEAPAATRTAAVSTDWLWAPVLATAMLLAVLLFAPAASVL